MNHKLRKNKEQILPISHKESPFPTKYQNNKKGTTESLSNNIKKPHKYYKCGNGDKASHIKQVSATSQFTKHIFQFLSAFDLHIGL